VRVRIGASDPTLTGLSGMAAVTEVCEQLGVVELLDAAVGPIKARARGHSAGELLVGLAAAQLAGEKFLVGLDRHRGDTAGQLLTPVPGLCSTTAAGLARRLDAGQWRAVETGLGAVTTRMLTLLPTDRAQALRRSVTIDMDTTDLEVYGRKKQRVAYNYQGQRVGRPHVASWAEAGTTLAAELGLGHRRSPPGADAGYFAADLAAAAHFAGIDFAIGANASHHCGACSPASPSKTGPRRAACPVRRSPSRTTVPPGGPRTPDC